MISSINHSKRVKRTKKRNFKKKSFRKNKRIKRKTKRKTKRIKKMKGGSGATMATPPQGKIYKQRPTLRTWSKRYFKIEGNSLNFYDNDPDKVLDGQITPRGSSITDLTKIGVTGINKGSISRTMGIFGTEYPTDPDSGDYDLITIDYLEGGENKTIKLAENKPPEWANASTWVDNIRIAITNISAGRAWNVSAEEQAKREAENAERERESVEREKKEAKVELMKINCLEEIPETELPSELRDLIQLRDSLEKKYSHSTINLDEFEGFGGMIDQFDQLRGPLKYDPYKFCGEDSYYLSLLQKFDIKPTTARGGSAIILTATSRKEDAVLNNLKCNFLGYNHDKEIRIYLRWDNGPTQARTFEILMGRSLRKQKLYNICNTITSLYFPAYARCVEIVLTPQPFHLKLSSQKLEPKKLPILFEALLYEGETCKGWDASIKKECNEGDYSQAQQKPLAMLHETILKGFLYPLKMIEHENKARNFTAYEPRVGDNYLFILNTTNNLKLFSCKVTQGVKFRMVIDIDFRDHRIRPQNLLLQESLTEFAEIMGIEKLQLEGGETLENFERGMEYVFDTCSSYLKEEHRFDLDSEYENTHIFVVDSLPWWNLSMPCLVNVTQAREENLQDLLNYKFLIQLLPIMIQSKDDEHKKELLKNNPEIQILISKLPESIRDAILELINTKSYDFNVLMGLIPEHIKQLLIDLL